MIDKLLNMLDRFNMKRATELIKKEVFQPTGDLVYDVETIILPNYRHVKTPRQVEGFLRHLQMTPYQHQDFQSGNYQFCEDSRSYSKCQEKHASLISFSSSWPSFHGLNEAQMKWYFYWRKEILSGNYLNTNSDYIIIFIFELLNYTFNDNAAFNLSMLDRLYMNYRDKNATLAHYLPQWIADFCYELGDYELEKKWAVKVQDHENVDYDNLKRVEDKLETVSITFWKRYIKYNKTKFFGTNRSLIYKVFKAAVSILKTNYQAQGKSLIDEWMPPNKKTRYERPLFRRALIGREVQNKVEVSRRPALKMREDLTALFRVAENIARMKAGEKRQLSVDETLFPVGFKNALIELFVDKSESSLFYIEGRFVKTREKGAWRRGSTVPDPPAISKPDLDHGPIIEFDFDRIDTLDKESKELLEIFTLRYEEEEEEKFLETLQKSEQKKKQPQISPQQVSDDEEAVSFIATLNELECEFLRGFKDLTRATQEGMQTLKTHGIMMGVFVSELNEKSLAYLGDNLVEQDGDVLSFNEDFEQVLCRLAKED